LYDECLFTAASQPAVDRPGTSSSAGAFASLMLVSVYSGRAKNEKRIAARAAEQLRGEAVEPAAPARRGTACR